MTRTERDRPAALAASETSQAAIKLENDKFTSVTLAGYEVTETAEADARLIAAAPELLGALQRLSAQCERLRMAWQLESDAERNARVVIAKAIGGAE